jgi:hypothetical protein
MKRDMDLVRTLLIIIENADSPRFPKEITSSNFSDLDGYPSDQIKEHLILMEDGNLILRNTASDGSSLYQYLRMSWGGHEFLETVMNDNIWRETKSVASKLGSFSLDIMKDLAVGYLKQRAITLGIPIA